MCARSHSQPCFPFAANADGVLTDNKKELINLGCAKSPPLLLTACPVVLGGVLRCQVKLLNL